MKQITQHGFATLEIVLALTILTCTLSVIILIVFGEQSILIDNQTNTEALTRASALLAQTEAISLTDFNLVNASSSRDTIYSSQLDVSTQDFFSKKISATISWDTDTIHPHHISLSKLITSLHTDDTNTCDSNLSGDWSHPRITYTTDFATLIHDSTHIYSISSINAHMNRLYVTVDKTSNPTDSTLFIFDISNPIQPELLGSIDNAPTISSGGIASLAIASSSVGNFVYVANGTASNFSTCSIGQNCSQLQIFNTRDPEHPILVTNYKLPSGSFPFILGSGGKAVGQSIVYANGYVYVGLSKTGGGPEFNIVDVHDPNNPQWIGGYTFGYTIHEMIVRNGYAYVTHTTDNTAYNPEQLTILDVHDPTNPRRISGFNDSTGVFNSGKSISIVGNTAYFGRLASKTLPGPTDTIPEFYALDVSNPESISRPILSTTSLATPESLHHIVVRDFLAFFLTTSELQIWNIANPTHIELQSTISLPTGGLTTPSMDCEKNNIFIGTNDVSGKSFLTIISSS